MESRDRQPIRLLAVTNMLPSVKTPALGTFIKQQIDSLIDIGIEVEVLLVDRVTGGMKSYWNLSEKVQAMVKASRPHIVHVMYGGIMADLATRAVGDLPAVVTFHGSDLLGENLSGVTRKVISRFGVRASFNAAARSDRVVVVSEQLRKILLSKVDTSKIRIIPCGIDLKRFAPLDRNSCCETLGWRSESFHVLFPANTGDPVKRPELAKSAVEILRSRGVDVELHLLSGVPYERVPLWFNGSDVLLLTSLHEGSPTVVKEALACDIPVVSVDVGDVSERIAGIDGCYLATPDPRDLAEKLFLVHSGPGRISSRQKIEALSADKVAIQLKELYQEVLGLSFDSHRPSTRLILT